MGSTNTEYRASSSREGPLPRSPWSSSDLLPGEMVVLMLVMVVVARLACAVSDYVADPSKCYRVYLRSRQRVCGSMVVYLVGGAALEEVLMRGCAASHWRVTCIVHRSGAAASKPAFVARSLSAAPCLGAFPEIARTYKPPLIPRILSIPQTAPQWRSMSNSP